MTYKKKTAKQAKDILKNLKYEVKDFKRQIESLSQKSFAYHLYNYQSTVGIPFMALTKIFNARFGTNLTDFQDVIALMKTSDEFIADNEGDEPSYPKAPIAMYLYMKAFWDRQLLTLKNDWNIDSLDLAIMIIEHQRDANYSPMWSNHLLRKVTTPEISRDEANKILNQAIEVLDNGDSVKQPAEFFWLLTVNTAVYLNELRLKERVEQCVRSNCMTIYRTYRTSADNKLSKLASKSLTKAGDGTAKGSDIKFSKDELLVLKVKGEKQFIAKTLKEVLALQ